MLKKEILHNINILQYQPLEIFTLGHITVLTTKNFNPMNVIVINLNSTDAAAPIH